MEAPAEDAEKPAEEKPVENLKAAEETPAAEKSIEEGFDSPSDTAVIADSATASEVDPNATKKKEKKKKKDDDKKPKDPAEEPKDAKKEEPAAEEKDGF